MDDLMDHDFAELEFLMILAVANVLCDHSNAIIIVSEAIASTVERAAIFFIVIIECADTVCLANAAVS
jgi:hypothetical protein